VEKFGKRHKEGSVHKARVLSTNSIDGLAQLSLQQSVWDIQFLRASDIKPGMLVTGTVASVEPFGMLVNLTDTIKVLCPPEHLSDVKLKRPENKFKKGEKISCRVLANNKRNGRDKVLVTAKKLLVRSKLPIIASYDDAAPGTVAHGVITANKEFGCLITFYNNVKGILPAASVAKLSPDVRDGLAVGKACKCKIVQRDLARERVTLSLDLDAEATTIAKISARGDVVKDVATGSLVTVTVTRVLSDALEVALEPSQAITTIKAFHLSDHLDLCDKLLGLYSVGQQIEDVLVVAKEGSSDRLLLSLKPALKAAAAKGKLASCQKLEDLVEGQTHVGYVRSVTAYGCFVGLVHGLVGLVNIRELAPRYIDSPAGDSALLFRTVDGLAFRFCGACATSCCLWV
jgi:rRNA biogenesis protein RRP5